MQGSMLVTAYLQSTVELVVSIRQRFGLLAELASRDITEEFVEHGFGKWWPVIHPIVLMFVYLFVFTYIFPSRLGEFSGLGVDHVVYLMSGIIPWILISQSLGRAVPSIVNNVSIVKQVAFPLEFLPLKVLAGPLVFGVVSLTFLVGYSLYLTGGASLVVCLWGVPILLAITIPTLVGLALLLASLQVFLRDIRELVNIFLSVGIFVHPILYFPTVIPDAIRPLLNLSPFTYLLYCWQDVFFFGGIERPSAWVLSGIFACLSLVVGCRIFMASKANFGDFL